MMNARVAAHLNSRYLEIRARRPEQAQFEDTRDYLEAAMNYHLEVAALYVDARNSSGLGEFEWSAFYDAEQDAKRSATDLKRALGWVR